MNLPMIEAFVQLTEQINGNDFLVGKNGLEIRVALKFQTTMTIVDVADKQINLNELIFHKQKNLIILSCLLFLLLIHIIYIGGAEYRKENSKNWIMRNIKSNNSDDGMGFTAKSEEQTEEFNSGEIEIDGEMYRILISKTVYSQSKISSINKIWINNSNLIYKEESRNWIGNFDKRFIFQHHNL